MTALFTCHLSVCVCVCVSAGEANQLQLPRSRLRPSQLFQREYAVKAAVNGSKNLLMQNVFADFSISARSTTNCVFPLLQLVSLTHTLSDFPSIEMCLCVM